MTATTVLFNGRVHTMDPSRPQASAVAIRDELILAVGGDDEMRAMLAIGGQAIDLGGRCLIPGLVDAHVHFQGFARSLQRVDLDGAATVDEALRRVTAQVARVPAGGWLQGRGWAQAEWPGQAFPTAAQLDTVSQRIPIYLTHKSGHAAWVNSRALRLAGVGATTPDPPGGRIARAAGGEPAGVLFEDAMDLVKARIPRPTIGELVEAMRQAQAYCWQVGLTGVHDFDGRACFQALQVLHENGELGLRVVKNIPVTRLDHAVGVGLRSGFGHDWLRIGGVKIFADGALGPLTAAMVSPYESDPDNAGIMVTDKEEMMAYVSRAGRYGLSTTIHAIGDRANHDVLDVFMAARAEEKEWASAAGATGAIGPLRHRIEHLQVMQPEDFERVAQAGVIASMQPTHATSDMMVAEAHWGPRTRHSYAWRSVLATGAMVVFGSDAPIERIDPLPGIYAAVTRRRADGAPGPDGWWPEQRLSVSEAVYAFTLAAAATAGQERRQGSITPGKLADLTLLERDIFSIPADELLDAGIAGTVVAGEFKYRNW